MAFGRKGAPIGNKNAAGKHHGHFGSGALKSVGSGLGKVARGTGRIALGTAKAVGIGAAYTAGVGATAVGAGLFIQSGFEDAIGRPKRTSKNSSTHFRTK